jgi:L-histidine Nalpha-methyltransferase
MSSAGTERLVLAEHAPETADFLAEMLAGLRLRPRRLPCKFLYDARGSQLFEQICTLPEYYLTRTEMEILAAHAPAMAGFCGPHCRLVELGSGSSVKTRWLLNVLESPAGYVPIDISRTLLVQTAAALCRRYPALPITPVFADYLELPSLPAGSAPCERAVVFFPGSTIGNFEPAEAVKLLRRIASWCRPGDRMLVGVDLEKSRSVVQPAYNDPGGVTAAFNRNILVRANAELGANFIVEHFFHDAVYNEDEDRIEMHLVSGLPQGVDLAGAHFRFEAGERMVTEYSYKHRPDRFVRIVRRAGWDFVQSWIDERGWFAVFALELPG